MDYAQFYQEGGPIMHLILLCGMLSAVTGLLALLLRIRPTSILALIVGAACIGLGVWGYLAAMKDLAEVMPLVAPDQLEQLRARGSELAMIPLKFAAVCAAPALLGGLLALVFRKRPR